MEYSTLSTSYIVSIFLGIAVGVLTSILLWFFHKILYKKCFLPWIETTLYRGIMINGKWNNEVNEGDEGYADVYKMILDINQKGHNIKGTFFAASKEDESRRVH